MCERGRVQRKACMRQHADGGGVVRGGGGLCGLKGEEPFSDTER